MSESLMNLSRRLARRGGVMRIQKEIYDTIRGVLTDRLKEVSTTP